MVGDPIPYPKKVDAWAIDCNQCTLQIVGINKREVDQQYQSHAANKHPKVAAIFSDAAATKKERRRGK